MKNRVNSLWLLASYSFLNINAETVLLKGITFSDRNKELFIFDTNLNIEKYLFKEKNHKELFEQLINIIKSNNTLFEDIKRKCNSTFKDLKIEKPEDIDKILNNFYYCDISEEQYGACVIPNDFINKNKLYLNLKRIPKITYKIENENIIDDNVVKDIKYFFDEYLKHNTNYPFNVGKIEKMLKDGTTDCNPHYVYLRHNNIYNFKIISDNDFFDIHNKYQKPGEIDENLYIDYNLNLTISFREPHKIYKTNLVFYVNGTKKDTLQIEENYELNDFDIKNYKYLHVNFVNYYLNLKDDDFTIEKDNKNRNINIKITNPSAIRYEITDAVNNKHIIYSCDKLTEREIVNIIIKKRPCEHVLYENSNRVDVNNKLEKEKYKIDFSKIMYKLKFYDKDFREYYFYKKATLNELKEAFSELKNSSLTKDDIQAENIFFAKFLDPTIPLEPGEYNCVSNIKNLEENKEDLKSILKKKENENQVKNPEVKKKNCYY